MPSGAAWTGWPSGARVGRLGRLDAEDLSELAGLVHLGDDVAAADQLAVDEELRDRRPLRDRAELLADARVGQDVDGRERRAERLQGGDRAGGEAAGRLLRSALHEEDTSLSAIASAIASRMGLLCSLMAPGS